MPDLTGFPALDLAIGLSFVFLLLSLLATAIQEFIAAILGLRARTLEQGLRTLLADDNGGLELVDDFYTHPLIKTLWRLPSPGRIQRAINWVLDHRFLRGLLRTHGPSYVSPRSFATFVLDQVAPPAGKATLIGETKIGVSQLPGAISAPLESLLTAADGDVKRFRKSVEGWFDDSMARVSGWYKRKTQVILLIIGIVLVVPALNANALVIGERLWKDPELRAAVVAQATKTVASATPTPTPEPAPGATPTPTPSAIEVASGKLDDAATSVDDAIKLGLPMGWSNELAKPHWDTLGGTATVIGGWLLTIVAISLGAPFWFDLLGRFSRLRSSGKPETPLPATGRGLDNERVPDV